MEGSESGVNKMKTWIHPTLYQQANCVHPFITTVDLLLIAASISNCFIGHETEVTALHSR